MKKSIFFLLISLSLLIISCRDKDDIVLNQTDIEAIDVSFKWGIVNTPYVACRESPSYEAKISKNLRKGAMEKIIGEKTVKVVDKDNVKYEKWLAFESGWVPENAVDIYMNKMRASKAIELYK